VSLAAVAWPVGYVVFLLAAALVVQRCLRRATPIGPVLGTLSMVWLAFAFYGVLGRWPSMIGFPADDLSEPWEQGIGPLILGGWIWLLIGVACHLTSALRVWIAQFLAAIVLLVALPRGASYADVMSGNAVWTVASVVAVGASALATEHLRATRAGRWTLVCFTVQLFLVAAVLLACYGTLGEFALVAALGLGCLAFGQACGIGDDRVLSVAWCATTLACLLLGHVRIYSATALPLWLAPLVMGYPAMVAAVDGLIAGRLPGYWRLGLAAGLTVSLVAVTLGWLILGEPGASDW
jgi:hypothetical protein